MSEFRGGGWLKPLAGHAYLTVVSGQRDAAPQIPAAAMQ
jgi:hypothetical protein